MTGEQALANAIIVRAAEDYKFAIRTLKKHPNSQASKDRIKEIIHFFHSPWYSVLTEADPDYLIRMLWKEAAK